MVDAWAGHMKRRRLLLQGLHRLERSYVWLAMRTYMWLYAKGFMKLKFYIWGFGPLIMHSTFV